MNNIRDNNMGKSRVSLLFLGCILSVLGNADRTLTVSEITDLLTRLTTNPRQTWLDNGVIIANHLQYYEQDDSIIESIETMRFDGSRFYWETRMLSANEPIVSSIPLSGSFASYNSFYESNKENIVCWDSNKYTCYFKSTGHATVEMGADNVPMDMYGPFTAGVVRWGEGFYSLSSLISYDSSAEEIIKDGETLIALHIINQKEAPMFDAVYFLDPEKDYAVVTYQVKDNNQTVIEQKCFDFRQIGSIWMPYKIVFETYRQAGVLHETLSYQEWIIQSAVPGVPDDTAFYVQFEEGALVELQAASRFQTLLYYARDGVDVPVLLESKISLAQDSTKQNCATAAVKYIGNQYSRTFSAEQVARLVETADNKTSLYQIKQSFDANGLYSAAVVGDLALLRQMQDCQIVVHLTKSDHYVVVDYIDEAYVWTIDLTSRKFYWRTAIESFEKQWENKIALIISDSPISLPQDQTLISQTAQKQIVGGDAEGCSCTDLLQSYDHIECSEPVGLYCGGLYYILYERYGCEDSAQEGYCVGQEMLWYRYSHCMSTMLGSCTITGQWFDRNRRACQ